MIYNIALSLFERGHEVTVLVDESVKSFSADMNESYAFNVVFIPGLETYALGKGVMRVPMAALYEHFSQIKYDVVQVCNFMPMLLVSMMRSLIRSPIVFFILAYYFKPIACNAQKRKVR